MQSDLFLSGRDTWYGWREYLLTGNIENEYAKTGYRENGSIYKRKVKGIKTWKISMNIK